MTTPARRSVPPGARSDFVGRTSELDALRSLCGLATSGSGQIVLIEGEAGIGKSRLLAESLEDAQRIGINVFQAACEELERRRPFGVVLECLGVHQRSQDPRRAEIAEVMRSSPASADPIALEGLEFRVSEALLELVDDLALAQPIAVVFDDLQWADPASLAFLHRLGRVIVELPAILIVAFRPVPRTPELDQLVRSLNTRGGVEVALGPLSDEEVEELLAELVGAPPGPNLRRHSRAAAGSPVFVRELVASLDQAGAISRDVVAEIETTTISDSLTLTILLRLSFLSPPTLEMLRVAAVLGSRFSTSDLALVTRRSVVELQTLLRESIDSGVLGEVEGTLRFRHDLIREALYNDLPGDVRAALHKETGAALASAGAPAGRVAEHLLRWASPGDRDAAAWLRRAATEALGRAPAIAADLLEKALELAGEADTERDAMLAELAISWMWSGRAAETERICREALQRRQDPELESTFRLYLTQALTFRGQMTEALAEAEAGLGSDAPRGEDRARLWALAAQSRLFVGDLDGAVGQAQRARSEAEAAGDALAGCTAIQTLAFIVNFRGDFVRAVDLQADAVRLADAAGPREAYRLPVHLCLGLFLLDLDRFEEAHRLMRQGLLLNEDLGNRWSLPFHHYALAGGLLFAGEWDDALAELQAGLTLADELDVVAAAIAANCMVAFISLHRDDVAAAEAAMSRADRALAERGPDYRVAWAFWLRALLMEASGRLDEAVKAASDAWAICSAVANTAESFVIGPDVVRIALGAGRVDVAEDVAAAAIELSEAHPDVPSIRGAALHIRGLIDRDADLLLRAAEAYRAGPRPLDRAAACEDAGAALAEVGRNDEAWPLFDEALELYEGLGAARDIARTDARARTAGLRRGRRGSRARPKTGWDALTPTERKVADLVTQGLTNRQVAEAMFLSPHTVHTHVSHVLAKVGVSSRVALAAAHASRGA